MVVGLTFVGVVVALLIQFRNIIGPLIVAFMLAYLLHPVAARFSNFARFPWRTAVNIIYVILVVLIAGGLTLAGLATVQQIQSLFGTIETFINNLPDIVANLSTQIYRIGPFQLDLQQFNLPDLANQVLSVVQPLLGRVGLLISSFATSAVAFLGWLLFILIISYFLLAEAGRFPEEIVHVDLPGYNKDIQRLGVELRFIWNAFLRGQMIIMLLVVIVYTILLMILGVRYSFAIAVMAGLARFVPYLGPLTVWIVLALVTFFQGSNYFNLSPLAYTLLAVGLGLIVDQIFDNLIVPRLLGHTLGVHPAAVMIAAIMATNLIGIVGLVLAAPVLATTILIMRYVLRKMFDLPPFREGEPVEPPLTLPWARSSRRLRAWLRVLQRRE